MTNHVDRPSLLQARDTHNHHRFHSFQNSRSIPDDRTEHAETHIRSPPEHQLQARQGPVVVVHTVSVVHLIDDTGALVEQSTLLPEPVLAIPNPAAVVTGGLGAVDELGNDITDAVLPTPIDPLGTPTPSASESLLSNTETLTSAPSTSTGFPLLSTGISNSTHYGNSTGLFLNTTRTSTARFKSSSSSPTLLTSFLNVPTETAGGAGGNLDANGIAGGAPTAPTTSPPAPPTSSGLTPAAQSAVIGGVVGSVAGIAIVAFVLMFILKWKRGHRSGLLLLPDGDEKGGRRDLFSGSKPGGGGGMQSTPFAIPSTLAALTGPRRAIEEGPSDAAEKGFYRVSGKRLRPVLESGGDGYSDPDPRQSTMSGVSDYRQSEAFLGGSMERLQLGSPMRPVSGVPIFRSGPNRTPVEATGPFSDYFQRPETPPTPMDPLGRSLTPGGSQQPLRGSPSRFAEGT